MTEITYRIMFLLLVLASCFTLEARDNTETKSATETCERVWTALTSRLSEDQPIPQYLQYHFQRFTRARSENLEKMEELSVEKVRALIGDAWSDIIPTEIKVDEASILEKAIKLPTDSESLLAQEGEYWNLQYRHFWGGGLRHPKDIERFLVLESRALVLDHLTGMTEQREKLSGAVTKHYRKRLKYGPLSERLNAIGHLAQIHTEEALRLISEASESDPKLAVRTSARLALLALGKPVQYKESHIRDIRRSPVLKNGEGADIAHEELSRTSDEVLSSFFDNSFLKVLDNDHSIDLFSNRPASFIAKFIQHEDPWIRGIAIRGIRHNYEIGTLELFRTALQDPGSYVNYEALSALSLRRDPLSRKLIEETADSHPDNFVRNMAQEIVRTGKWKFETTSESRPTSTWKKEGELRQQLKSSNESEAIAAAKELGDRKLDLIESALESDFPSVRKIAADFLAQRRHPEAVSLAIRSIQPEREPVTEVRLALLDALFRAKSLQADHEILRLYNDPRTRVRTEVAKKAKNDTILRNLTNLPARHATLLNQGMKSRLDKFQDAEIRADHRLARHAAEHVYALPEPSDAHTATELVRLQELFLAGMPQGQRVKMAGTDPGSGLKFYYSHPMPGLKQRSVLAFAGTENRQDVYADFNLGFPQVKSPLFEKLKSQLLKDVESGIDVDITGHSLGGVPAGVMAYELEVARAKMKSPGEVRLITWNGLGAKDVVSWRGKVDTEAMERIEATNYHVPGDMVWRLANSFGENVALPGNGVFRPYTSHVMAAIAAQTDDSPGLRRATPVTRLLNSRIAPLLARTVGSIGTWLQSIRYRRNEMATLRRVLEARIEWANQSGYREMEPDYDPWSTEMDVILQRMKDRSDARGENLAEAYDNLKETLLFLRRRPALKTN